MIPRFATILFGLVAMLGARAQGTNDILLHASAAIVHGDTLRYEPETNKNCLGYWTNPKDWAEWKFKIPTPGVYEIELWQGCGRGQGGSDVRVEVDGHNFDFVVDETGHFQSFIPRKLGRVRFATSGEYSLAVKPQNKKAAAVLDVRQVRLLRAPAKGATSLEQAMLDARRIVFLGDSITYTGEYIDYIEAFLRLRHPRAELDIINLGLPSETVSGLTEEGHAGGQFPRPDLHERLGRVLEKARPDLIVACYGMNDGIYLPFDDERFDKFQKGVMKLRAVAIGAGAKVVFLTPPTFDPPPKALPVPGVNPPAETGNYNDVLDKYSEWLLSQRANGWTVIDVHGVMNRELAERKKANPKFRFAGDGVHPDSEGHRVIGRAIVTAMVGMEFKEPGTNWLATVKQKQRVRRDAWLTHVGHTRPFIPEGKPIGFAEDEARQMVLQMGKLLDPQFPGKRVLWNGFESYVSPGMTVVEPKRIDPARPWIANASLSEAAIRDVGRGAFLVVGVPKDESNIMAARYGLSSAELVADGPADELGRPLIRKLGTVDMDLVETTPIALGNRLWRFEWVRDGYWDNQRKTNYFRFRDPKTGQVTEPFADGHEFGSAFLHGDTVYVTGTLGRGEINVFASKDLKSWEKWNAIPSGKYGIFNTSLCKAGNEFVLMFEIDKPVEEAGAAFTARFAKSNDLRAWTMTPPECNYAKDRYTAPHALRWLDGWFYNFYLEAHDGYEMRVVRSRDLIKWEASPLNPALKASPEDRRIASDRMPNDQRTRVANAVNRNNSDIDFVEFNGKLYITYSWGNQLGVEHLAEAIYDGPEAEFLRGWFPSRAD